MTARKGVGIGLVVGVVGVAVVAQPPPRPADDVKALRAEFTAAFKAKDAAAVARLWAADAELLTAAGDTFRGRKEIEAAYAALFASKPDVTAEVESGTVRSLGTTAAVLEGVLKLSAAADAEPDVTVFRAVVVKEADGWRFAAVECWEVDPEPGAVVDLEWLVGEWAGKRDDGAELRATYSWQEGKQFLRCVYSASVGGKTTGGTQVIGRGADGQLRGWLFDNGGSVGESTWAKDGTRWLIAAESTTPEGGTATATNVLVKLGPDEFTWQAIDRTVDDEPQPDGRPLKMTRAKN